MCFKSVICVRVVGGLARELLIVYASWVIVANEMTARMVVEMGCKWKKREGELCLIR